MSQRVFFAYEDVKPVFLMGIGPTILQVIVGWSMYALMGMALGGLLPCMAAVIRHSVPERFVGSAMGWSLSAQFAGQVIGPVIGGFVGGQFGMRSVFLVTSLLMLAGALFNWRALGHSTR